MGPDEQDCPGCGDSMSRATVPNGGYVAWFCWSCELLKPAEGIKVKKDGC